MRAIKLFILILLITTSCKKETIINNDTAGTTVIEDTTSFAIKEPDTTVKVTESYAKMLARDTYFWAWPMVNIYNRRLAFKQAPKAGLMNGVLPFAPLNTLSMLHDYIEPEQRWVACPNQDVVYGAAIAALDETPVVVQVPDFGSRFWVYQIVDLRTDSFAGLGKMYNTKPGFYLVTGPNWKGEVPKGITKVFKSPTNTAFVVPRVFQDDNAQDRQAVQKVINQIDVYPLDKFDGKMKQQDWSKLPKLESPMKDGPGGETKWVFPDKFFDELPLVLKDAPPLPGEEARYAQIKNLLAMVKKDPALKKTLTEELIKVEAEMIDPLLQFRNWGSPLSNHWTTVNNGATFGTDYFARTAVAKSNILVNAANETKYLYQDLDASGTRLNGASKYTITFLKGQTPPIEGFWSLTLYDEHHFFVPNEIKRYSLGTKNKTLKFNPDSSLTIYVQASAPSAALKDNWLPAPKTDFSLYLRAYWPKEEIINGKWMPPAVEKVK
ncbi:hypothetical protein EV144_101381 [Flavobacterium sp. 270]|uniref:DUF1254 domain-containing protein n=1 Tax=Flavobacterium sp. 270 TaxID=2512114 RepID=UPI001066D6B9|nr:DUF1254 domain-containing protein [Flavobacterium sp. 270]TDW51705.1 hypothetical protein EV144_101381 [Flavobacterium sp. 270]